MQKEIRRPGKQERFTRFKQIKFGFYLIIITPTI